MLGKSKDTGARFWLVGACLGGCGLEGVWQISRFACRSGDFRQIVPLPVVLFSSFCKDELVVTLGVGLDSLERKNKTVFPGIVG